MSTIAPAQPTTVTTDRAPTVGAEALPRVLTSVLVGAFVCASLAPSLLPRSALTQALVTALFAAVGLGLSALVHRISRSRSFLRSITEYRGHRRHRLRIAALVTATGAAITATVCAAEWQNSVRSAMGAPSAGVTRWMEFASEAAAIFFVLYLVGTGVTAVCTRLGAVRFVLVTALLALGMQSVVGPSVWTALEHRFGTSNSAIDPALSPPTSTVRSGSADSAVSWATLGREGRKFVTADGDANAVRTYVGLDSAPTLEQRTSLAIHEMERADAFSRSAIVVAIPTGSGWIDDHAVSGIESRFGGDVATVGLQYSYEPSWATFLFAQAQARDAATELLDAVASRIEELPVRSRPALYTYGQSLGSVGGGAAYAAERSRVCAALWAGPPAGAVETSNAVVLANSSDPVVRWSTDLLFTPPDLSRTRADAPAPQWIPIVGFLQTTVDMITALDAPAGHGHRYGTDQGTALPRCDGPESNTEVG